jgi:hypothetical protein
MAWMSAIERCALELQAALPGLSPRTANSIVRNLYHRDHDINAMIECLRIAPDSWLLGLRNVGVMALAEVRAALAETDYTPGQCNWVGEGVPG